MLSRALLVSLAAALAVAPPLSASVGPSLQSRLAGSRDAVRVVVLLEASPLARISSSLGRPSAAADTREIIQSSNQALLDAFFDRVAHAGITLRELEVFWLSPAVAALVEGASISALDALPGVAAVIEDAPVELPRPVREVTVQSAYDATAAGMDVVGVRTMWHQGLTGRGTLIASLDTGVDGLHPALRNRYRGNHAEASAVWRDAQGGTLPNDPMGHGTHTLGTVLGCEASDTVGIAPEAEWIAAGVVDRGRTFSETISDLLGAFQWLADPDGRPETSLDRPDVVLNSWGIPQGILPACDGTFWQVVDHLEALGTVVIFAAGNEGPGPSTLRQPADRGDGHLSCFSVGAVDALDPTLGSAPFSSRGPASCNPTVIKPELVAPGVNVRSCARGGGYRLLSGTSMAAPYVAGAVCLLRQYNPDATPFEIKEALVRSALDVGQAGPDFNSGFGLLNIPGAIAELGPAQPLLWRISADLLAAAPGDAAEPFSAAAEIQLENLGRSLRGVDVTLRPRNNAFTIQGPSTFSFEYLPKEQGLLRLPVSVLAEGTTHGDRLWLELILRADSPEIDTTITLGIKVGSGPGQAAMTLTSGGLDMVATNVGRFDAREAAVVSVQLPEFAYDGVVIPLTGGLEIHTPSSVISSFGPENDFEPAPLGQLWSGSEDVLATSRIRDTRHPDPAGVELDQRVYAGTDGPGAYFLVDYAWQRLWNTSREMRLAGWFHWQPATGSVIVETGASDEWCLEGDGIYFGCVWLSSARVERSFAAYDPDALTLPVPNPRETPVLAASYWARLREEWQSAPQGGFALAFVAGRSPEEWNAAAARAREQFEARAGSGDGDVLPATFTLEPNYPNPFNPATTIRFTLESQAFVHLEIFNGLGRRVATLIQAERPAGTYEVNWQATDTRGLPCPSGTYFIRISAGDEVRSGKMSLVR